MEKINVLLLAEQISEKKILTDSAVIKTEKYISKKIPARKKNEISEALFTR